MTADHRGQTYRYSAENQLMWVYAPDGATTLGGYAYYADGTRRIAVVSGATTERYFYDGDQAILDTDGSAFPIGVAMRRYIRLPGSVDEVLLMIDYTAGNPDGGADGKEVWGSLGLGPQ